MIQSIEYEIAEQISRQEKAEANAKSFPIGSVLETVLEEEGIPFLRSDAGWGFDVRIAKTYELVLPARIVEARAIGYLGRREQPYKEFRTEILKSLKDVVYGLSSSFSKKYGGRCVTCDIRSDSRSASCIATAPRKEQTKSGFIDVVEISVKGIYLTHMALNGLVPVK